MIRCFTVSKFAKQFYIQFSSMNSDLNNEQWINPHPNGKFLLSEGNVAEVLFMSVKVVNFCYIGS